MNIILNIFVVGSFFLFSGCYCNSGFGLTTTVLFFIDGLTHTPALFILG